MKKIKIYIVSILTAFCIFSEHILKEIIINYGRLSAFNFKDINKFIYSNTDFLLIFGITIALIFFYKKYNDIKKEKGYNILSFIFALLLTLGFSYSVVEDASLVTGNIVLILLSTIKLIMYYKFISLVINLVMSKIKQTDFSKIKEPSILKRFKNYYEGHPYKTTIIIILLAWLPYIISFYPSILSPDPSNQIKQYFGMETHYIEGVKLIDENILITNHHPVFHTFILGGFTKLGEIILNVNFGLFLFSCFHIFVLVSALTYSLVYLKKLKVPFIFRFIILIIYALLPIFPLYALSPVKDTMFAALLIFFLIETHKLLTRKDYTKTEYLTLGLLMLFMMLVRNNGVYIIVFSIISLIIVLKEKRLQLILTIIATLFVYEAHNKILLPIMHITPGSIREVFSVPFQQTARYVKYHSEDLDSHEVEVIDKVLGYDTLAKRYKPNIVDPVKNEFNKETTTEDLKEYFKVWGHGLINHPMTYINATVNTVYGYFYPNTSNWYIYHNYDHRLINSGIDYHYNKLEIPRQILSGFGLAYPYIPLLGAQVNIGWNVWIYMLLLTYLIIEKQKKYIPLLMPAFVLLLTCVVGPVNTYFRYMVPIVFSLPFIISVIITSLNKKA